MKALVLGMLVLSKMFVMDTWGRVRDYARKVLFLRLVALALRVKAGGLALMTMDSDSEVNWPDFENQGVAVESERVHSIDAWQAGLTKTFAQEDSCYHYHH
jgi:hypothetical protein